MEIPVWLAGILVSAALSWLAYCAREISKELQEIRDRLSHIEGRLGAEGGNEA